MNVRFLFGSIVRTKLENICSTTKLEGAIVKWELSGQRSRPSFSLVL
ncbi:hypothetical protein LEP1GSC133_1044 [Leptospira borgpetersenii serovar Pomona str. 200901868]|uniref:Uncharacterized protein n=1 Tax=Leptospira borgpetersenii serovar Pomona str. 200901868 TaxID=1192866 RepID=M6W4P7_LEPBO|nr:hypothetical protein LEP1GSC133_1044 [Leptospira borgpetersenii serovar Pomona str. 200901868]